MVAADGTVLSPDLQPVPPGFNVSACGKLLLRPNGKPVPQGVHVGPGFRLLKPTGEHLPDGGFGWYRTVPSFQVLSTYCL